MWHAKHMCVILNETAHSCQASQRATCLVSMDDAKLGHSYRQFFVASIARIKDQTVARTIHGLERPFFFLNIQGEHVIFIVLPVTGRFPEFGVEHVRRDHWGEVRNSFFESTSHIRAFLISTFIILSLKYTLGKYHEQKHAAAAHPQEFHEGVVNTGAVGKPKRTTRTKVVEEEKLLLL
jgi:hypothetical protein